MVISIFGGTVFFKFGGTQSFLIFSEFGGTQSFLKISKFCGTWSFLYLVEQSFLNLVEHSHF